MNSAPGVIGAVLCGGSSTRMGADKAAVQVRGVPMARLVADALSAGGCRHVVAVGGAGDGHGLEVLPDRAPGEGPLGGVVSILESFAGTGSGPDPQRPGAVMMVSCDLPFLDGATVAALLRRAAADDVDLVVATTDRVEPMVAVWSLRALPVVRRAFEAGERSIRRVVPLLDVVFVPVDPRAVRNVNTPADLPD